jgi:hypothetical protein
MSTIGIDCEIMLDTTGYFLAPDSYTLLHPRIRKATVRADGGNSYVDLGPGKREWEMTILCVNELLKYDGTPTGFTGQQYRDALHTSYTNSIGTTITFIDPIGTSIAVHFDHYEEHIADAKSQQIALALGESSAASYEVAIVLLEA